MSLPLEDYALIGDGGSCALISRSGSVDWLCWPRFDSDACIAGLLGQGGAGKWSLQPAGGAGSEAIVARRYRPDTLILETEVATATGSYRLTEFMTPAGGHPALIRRVTGLAGRCRISSELQLRFDYGQLEPWTELGDQELLMKAGPHRVLLQAPATLQLSDGVASAEVQVSGGDELAFVLLYGAGSSSAAKRREPLDVAELLDQAHRRGSTWVDKSRLGATRWPQAVRRSLLTLKALTFEETGAIIAAPTTSLPETPGGGDNWDYRYCWLRDSTFTLGALVNAGFHEEARRWRDWLVDAVGGAPEDMRIMYRVDGDRHLGEWIVDGLEGYGYARPVRVGNAASTQRQADVWGEVMDMLHLADLAGLPPHPRAEFIRRRLVEHVAGTWKEPGSGLWESRKEPRPYTYSRVMAWVAVDRFLKSEGAGLGPEERERWTSLRSVIHADVIGNAWNPGLGAFTEYLGGETLDASVLLLPIVGFIPASDPRMVSTVKVIRERLGEGGLIRRKPRGPELPVEGVFLACSFWMADCLRLQGDVEGATKQVERVLEVASELGLWSEEYDVVSGRLCGNYPQGLTHLGFVNAALGLAGTALQRGGG